MKLVEHVFTREFDGKEFLKKYNNYLQVYILLYFDILLRIYL